jgi:hypothetical protein
MVIINMKTKLVFFLFFIVFSGKSQIILDGAFTVALSGSDVVTEIPQDSTNWRVEPLEIAEGLLPVASKRYRPKDIFTINGETAILVNVNSTVAGIASHYSTLVDPYVLIPRDTNLTNGYMLDTLPQETEWQNTRAMAQAIMYDEINEDWIVAMSGEGTTTPIPALDGIRYIGIATTTDFNTWTFPLNNPIITSGTTGISTYAPDSCDAVYPVKMWYDNSDNKYKMIVSATANEADGDGSSGKANVVLAESTQRDSGWTIVDTVLSNIVKPSWMSDVALMDDVVEVNGTWWTAVRSDQSGEAGSTKIGLAYSANKEGPYTYLDDYIINVEMATSFDLSDGISSALLDFTDGRWRIYSDFRDSTLGGMLIFTALVP